MVKIGSEPKAALAARGQGSSLWCLTIIFLLLSFGLHLGVFACLFSLSFYSISELLLIHGFSLLMTWALRGPEWPLAFLSPGLEK